MAAIQKPQEFKDWKYTPGPGEQDSEGAVQDFQKRKMAYDKYVRDFQSQAGPKPGLKGPAAGATKGAISARPTPAPGVTGPGAGGATAPSVATTEGGAPTASEGFSLDTPWRKGKGSVANEGKGEFGSENWEAKYNKIANEITGIYNEQMPMLRNYDQMVQTQVDQLIGTTMPQVQEMFRQSGEQYGYAKDFYQTAQESLGTAKDYLGTTKDYLGTTKEYLGATKDYYGATKKFYNESQGYDTAARREQERGEAMTDVRMAGEASRTQAIERLESFGIDPSQARGAALDQNLRLEIALNQARAATQAEQGVEERGRQYKMQGLSAMESGAGMYGQGVGAVGQGVGAVGQGVGAVNQATGMVGQGASEVGAAAMRTQAATQTGANILGQNVQAQAAAKAGAIQTGQAGANLLGQVTGTVQSSENARRAMQASRAATAAAKSEGKASGWAGIGQLTGQLGAAAISAYAPAAAPLAQPLMQSTIGGTSPYHGGTTDYY